MIPPPRNVIISQPITRIPSNTSQIPLRAGINYPVRTLSQAQPFAKPGTAITTLNTVAYPSKSTLTLGNR